MKAPLWLILAVPAMAFADPPCGPNSDGTKKSSWDMAETTAYFSKVRAKVGNLHGIDAASLNDRCGALPSQEQQDECGATVDWGIVQQKGVFYDESHPRNPWRVSLGQGIDTSRAFGPDDAAGVMKIVCGAYADRQSGKLKPVRVAALEKGRDSVTAKLEDAKSFCTRIGMGADCNTGSKAVPIPAAAPAAAQTPGMMAQVKHEINNLRNLSWADGTSPVLDECKAGDCGCVCGHVKAACNGATDHRPACTGQVTLASSQSCSCSY